MFELIPHLLEHAFEDTIYLVPFLLVTYFLLEALEHKAGNRTEELVQKAGKLGPAVAAVLGEQCPVPMRRVGVKDVFGHSGPAWELLEQFGLRSDAIIAAVKEPLFIAEQVDWHVMAGIVGVKVAIGMIMGFAIDGVLRFRLHLAQTKATQEHNHEHARFCNCKHEHAEDHAFGPDHCHNPSCHCASAHTGWTEIAVSAVKHTLEVSIIVFLISLALVAVMEVAGEEAVATFLASNPGLAIFGSALVGLIPNCGASVVITQLYLDGMLGTGAMLSGLLVSAGVGILVLFGENRRIRQNVAILAGLYATGVAWGLLFQALGITFM